MSAPIDTDDIRDEINGAEFWQMRAWVEDLLPEVERLRVENTALAAAHPRRPHRPLRPTRPARSLPVGQQPHGGPMTTRTAWRACHPDLRSSYGYRWPWPGNEATAPLPDDREFTRGDPCPRFIGDGLCLAKTWRGAASGGIPAITCLLVEFEQADVLCEDDDKIRVSRCRVVDVFDGPALIRDGWCRRADLGHANLRHANLWDADLRHADLGRADLGHANLRDADLRDADLGRADLGHADLRGANLRVADLRGADLGGANLRGADLGDADLRGANLGDANLRGADLGDANLRGANLGDANLRGANLRVANLRGAVADEFTVWPDRFDHAARGVTVVR